MINLKPIITASAVLLLLNACSSDSTTDATDGTDIPVVTISGVTTGLNGTYSTGCYGNANPYTEETLVVSGNTWNYTNTTYTDVGCTAGAAVFGTISGTIAASVESAITGWVNGNGDPDLPPITANFSGPLSETESFTTLTLTISAGTGEFSAIPANTTGPLFYVVDDTGTNNILYRDDDFENGSNSASTADPYTKQ